MDYNHIKVKWGSQNNVFLLLSDSDYRNLLNTDSVKAEVQIKAIVQGKSGKGWLKQDFKMY